MSLTVHAQDDVLAHHRTHDHVDDVTRRERLGVPQHAGDVLEPIDEEDRERLVMRHPRRVEPLYRMLLSRLGELRVGVSGVSGDRVVEEAELVAVSSSGLPVPATGNADAPAPDSTTPPANLRFVHTVAIDGWGVNVVVQRGSEWAQHLT